jgi:hypothetical protein
MSSELEGFVGYISREHRCGEHDAYWYEIIHCYKDEDGDHLERFVTVAFGSRERVNCMVDELNDAVQRGNKEGMKEYATELVKANARAERKAADDFRDEAVAEADDFESDAFERAQAVAKRCERVLREFGVDDLS